MNANDSWRWYKYQWVKAFSPEQIKGINKQIEDTHLNEEHKRGTDWKNLSSVKMVSYGNIKSFVYPLVEHAYGVGRYDFGYDLFPHEDDRTCNFNIYDSKDKADYDWHSDGVDLPFVDCKLTLLINLSEEPYEGGEFQLMPQKYEETIEEFSEPGSAFMFKSHILHRVKPLISGVRKSLTIFMNGPRFR